MKSRIVEQLGQAEILLPGLVAEGLSANDRAKVRMSALQAAVEHAHDPLGQAADLAAECRNAGVDAVATRSLIAGARNMASGIIDAPGLAKLGEALLADVATMIQAVSAGDAGSGKAAEDRFAALSVKLGLGKPQIAETEIAELTAVASGTRDSLHRLVMDLHKALNRLAAQCAEEVVAGAHTHGHREVPEDPDVQDVEFTIEDSRLWFLQSRAAKRTPRARSRSPSISCGEGLISEQQGLAQLQGLDLEALAITHFADSAMPAARGIAAAGGVAAGIAAFDAATAERLAAAGDPVILMRKDIDTADVKGLAAASGVVTASGGRTAHASLIARQLGKACVVSCAGLEVDAAARRAEIDGRTIREGDWISVDGDTGDVFLGQREIVTERPEAELNEVAKWRAQAYSQPERGDLAHVD